MTQKSPISSKETLEFSPQYKQFKLEEVLDDKYINIDLKKVFNKPKKKLTGIKVYNQKPKHEAAEPA